jgi:Rad3-related DNA helicase
MMTASPMLAWVHDPLPKLHGGHALKERDLEKLPREIQQEGKNHDIEFGQISQTLGLLVELLRHAFSPFPCVKPFGRCVVADLRGLELPRALVRGAGTAV